MLFTLPSKYITLDGKNMKINKIFYMIIISLHITITYSMDLVHTPIISGRINDLNIENELSNNEYMSSANLAISKSSQYILVTQNNKLYLLNLCKIPKEINKPIILENMLLINDHTSPSKQAMPITVIEKNDHLIVCSAVNINDNKVELIIRKIQNNISKIIYQKIISGTIGILKSKHNESHIAIAYTDSPKVIIFDIETLKNIKTITIPIKKTQISALSFNIDNTVLFIGTSEGSLYLFDLEKNEMKNSQTFVRKSNMPITGISYLKNQNLQLTTQDGAVLILNSEGEIKKRFYSSCFGKNKVYKRNNAVLAPYSQGIAFYITNIDAEEDKNELGYIELQINNKIMTLHASNFNPVFIKKFKDNYAHLFKCYLTNMTIGDLINNTYTIAALSADSQIHIWQIPIFNKLVTLKPGSSRILDNGSLSNIKRTLEKEKKDIQLQKKYSSFTFDYQLPKKRATLKEIIAESKKDEIEYRKKHPRPAPPLPRLSRANTAITRKKIKKTFNNQRTHSLDTGMDILHKETKLFDLIHKKINIETKINMLTTLLNNKKININKQDKYGNTILYWETQRTHIPIMRLLLKNKANPNTKNKEGNSPLHAAVQKRNYRMAKTLLKHGANPNIQNNLNDTPAHHAAKNNLYKIIMLLLNAKANSCIPNSEGNTILHIALIYKSIETIQEIVKKCDHSTLIFQNQQGNSPLHIAVATHINSIALKLIKKKVLLNTQNYHGDTPLHLAVRYNNHAMISALTKKSALFDIPNNKGETALDLMK